MESGVHSSLHANYHYQRICDKFNLKFNYPPPYKREIWHHEQANADIITIVDLFPWEKAFRNLKTILFFHFKKWLRILFLIIFLMKLHLRIVILHGLRITHLGMTLTKRSMDS